MNCWASEVLRLHLDPDLHKGLARQNHTYAIVTISFLSCAVHILANVNFLLQLSLFSEVSTLTSELHNLGVLRDTGRICLVCVAGL